MALLQRLTILYAMLNFLGFLFSLLKGIYNTCAIHTQVSKQASVARILLAGFFGIFSASIKEILLDAQLKEYNTMLSTTPNTDDDSQNNTKTTPTAPHLQSLNHNHRLSIVPRNFRIIALTDPTSSRSNYPQSPIQHIITQQPNKEDTYEQFIEQLTFFPKYTYFHSDPNDENPNYVNEPVLYPTLSWTSFYHFSNPLSLPLYNPPMITNNAARNSTF